MPDASAAAKLPPFAFMRESMAFEKRSKEEIPKAMHAQIGQRLPLLLRLLSDLGRQLRARVTFNVQQNMKKIRSLLLAVALVCIAGCQSAATSPARIPKDQQAKIEGLSFTATLLNPIVRMNWPDLRSFDIINVTGAGVVAFSRSKATVGAGPCSITVEATADWHQPATRILTFEAKAGKKYALRPVYQDRVIEATIQDESTLEIVAQSWGSKQQNARP